MTKSTKTKTKTKTTVAKAPKMKAVKQDEYDMLIERIEELEKEVGKLQFGPLKKLINRFRGNG